eukprot:14548616-Alexandrium_andersonii.AAC.1
MRADKELFRRLAEETRSGLPSPAAGGVALDALVGSVAVEAGVQVLLRPLPGGRSTESPSANRKKAHQKRS